MKIEMICDARCGAAGEGRLKEVKDLGGNKMNFIRAPRGWYVKEVLFNPEPDLSTGDATHTTPAPMDLPDSHLYPAMVIGVCPRCAELGKRIGSAPTPKEGSN